MKNFALSLICLLLFFLSFIYLLEKNRHNLYDAAPFVADNGHYQALGVNLSLGHSYKSGCIEKFETYRLNIVDSDPESKKFYDDFINEKKKGKFYHNFYRTPGYPFFLASVYKLFGIHPRIVKILQIIMLALSVSLLPIIGNYYWPGLGIIAGILSSFLTVWRLLPNPSYIMAESLITFSLFILTIFLILWETKPSTIRTFLLGTVCGITILIKGSNIFIAPFLLLYILLKFYRSAKKNKLLFVFTLGLILFIAPWNIYASKRQHTFLLLATQPTMLLLDSNNEDSLKTGDWEPAWYKKNKDSPKYIYNRLKKNGYSQFRQFFIFMWQNKKEVPAMLKNKLLRGFLNTEVFPIVTGMFLYYLAAIIAVKPKGTIEKKVPVFPLIYFLNILLITLIFYGSYRFILPFLPFFILPAAYLFLKIVKLLMSLKPIGAAKT